MPQSPTHQVRGRTSFKWSVFHCVCWCVCHQVGDHLSSYIINGCHCWEPFAAWLLCSCWLGGQLSLPSVLSSSCWDTRCTRSLVKSDARSKKRSVIAVTICSILTTLLFRFMCRCELGVLCASEFLQHRSEPVCRPQPCGGTCQELQVSKVHHMSSSQS